MNYEIETMLRFIRNHEVDCHYTSDGKLMVEDVSVEPGDAPIETRIHREWIEIEPSAAAIREFLGY